MADGYARTSDDDELLSDADDASSSTSQEKCSEGQGGKVAQSKHRVKGYDAKWKSRFPWIRFKPSSQ